MTSWFAGDLAEGRTLLGGRVERSSRLVSGKVCRTSRRTKQTLLDCWRRLRQRDHHRPRPRRVRHNPHPPSLLFTLIKIIDAPWFIVLSCSLCPALKAVFEHGLKRSSLLGGSAHPWIFIEEVWLMAWVISLPCEAKVIMNYVLWNPEDVGCGDNVGYTVIGFG